MMQCGSPGNPGSPGGQVVVNYFTVCVGKPADDTVWDGSGRFGTLSFLGAKALRQGRGS